MNKLLLVQDGPDVNLSGPLQSWGYICKILHNCEAIEKEIETIHPQAVICNKCNDNHCKLLTNKSDQNDIPIIVIGNEENIETAVRYMKSGVFDYISNPADHDILKSTIETAVKYNRQNKNHLANAFAKDFCLPGVIGNSTPMLQLAKRVTKVAPSQSNIMIVGETGTGKELIAKSVHHFSKRSQNGFFPIDCSIFNSNLLESELFGYEKGAFTGATESKKGLFQAANKGTVFFDEITELDINLQTKLLRAIQEKEFRKLGGQASIKVDLRFIAATNRHLEQAVLDKKLRQDLLYRLNVVTLNIPPLRERKSDIPVLTDYFLSQYKKRYQKNIKYLEPGMISYFVNYDWPGNVRELQNIVEQMTVMAETDTLLIKNLPPNIYSQSTDFNPPPDIIKLPYHEAKEKNLKLFYEKYFGKLFKENNGNISKVSRISGISRKAIYEIINNYNIKK